MTTPRPHRRVDLAPIVGEVVAADHAEDLVVPGDDPTIDAPTGPPDPTEPTHSSTPARTDGFRAVLPGDDPDEQRLQASRRALDHLRASGRFVALPGPAIAVLTLDDPGRHPGPAPGGAEPWRTVAIVGDVEVAAYDDGRILPHEHVDPHRVDALVRYLEIVATASTPVCVTHRPSERITEATDDIRSGPPDRRFTMRDGVGVQVHLVTDPASRRRLTDAIASVGQLYLADGHHRAAAVARTAGPDPRVPVLTAVVPTDHLRVHAFHRRIDPVRALDADEVLDDLTGRGLRVHPLDGREPPTHRGVAHLAVGTRWWRVELRRPDLAVTPRPALDAELARRELIDPLLELAGPGATEVAIPGPAGTGSLARAGSVGITLFPPSIDEVLAVAEAGEAMPPKATYLAPKVPAGILLRPRTTGSAGA